MLKLQPHSGLATTSRLRGATTTGTTPAVRDWIVLMTAGAVAALASTFIDFSLRIPGHAILRAVFPMTIGLALVPRYGAGTVMGCSAIATALVLHFGGFVGTGLGLGAMTSLSATGPLLDWTLRRSDGGWRMYLAFATAGLTSNLLAFVVRGTAKAAGWEHLGRRPLAAWLPPAAISYAVCGLLAGLLAGAVWFYGRRRSDDPSREMQP